MQIRRRDVVTPANALSFAGLIFTIIGALIINSFLGVLLIGLGRALDLLDGPVARRTHTSGFGILVDALFDKLAIAAIVLAALNQGEVYLPILAWVSVQNSTNMALSAWVASKGKLLHSNRDGKHTMFFQISSVGFLLLANVITPGIRPIALAIGIIAAIISVPLGLKATWSYARKSIAS